MLLPHELLSLVQVLSKENLVEPIAHRTLFGGIIAVFVVFQKQFVGVSPPSQEL